MPQMSTFSQLLDSDSESLESQHQKKEKMAVSANTVNFT